MRFVSQKRRLFSLNSPSPENACPHHLQFQVTHRPQIPRPGLSLAWCLWPQAVSRHLPGSLVEVRRGATGGPLQVQSWCWATNLVQPTNLGFKRIHLSIDFCVEALKFKGQTDDRKNSFYSAVKDLRLATLVSLSISSCHPWIISEDTRVLSHFPPTVNWHWYYTTLY